MPVDIFTPAIKALERNNSNIFGPEAFQQYLATNELPQKNTAQYISVDSLERLHPSLRKNEIMVFRLGTSPEKGKRGTQFALIKANLNDFFISQPEENQPVTYLPKVGIRDMFAYQILPMFTENSLVGLALASGLMSYALGLEEGPINNPATGQSTFTFELELHSEIKQIFLHNKGQVEIDSLFLGRKAGEDTIFVLEAKSKYKSLAKHKLVYPILAIAERIPKDIKIVPVYMKIDTIKTGFIYHIMECAIPDPRKQIVAIDQLRVVNHTCYFLPKL